MSNGTAPKISYKDLTNDEVFKLYNENVHPNMKFEYYDSKGFRFNKTFEPIEKTVDEFEVFDDDIWISSFPKSGTTWLSEMVWSICNDLKSPAADELLDKRVCFLEYEALFKFDDPAMDYVSKSIEMGRQMKRPRFIKSHIAWPLLPRQLRNFERRPRIIHVYRNPKDIAVSYYHHNRLFRGYSGDPELFYEAFLREIINWSPCIETINSFWEHRHEPNVLLLKFEDMKKDMKSVILQVGRFLNIQIDDAKMAQLMQRLSFENMRKNESSNMSDLVKYVNEQKFGSQQSGTFIRKGKVGAHLEEMSAETAERINAWIKSKAASGINLLS